MEKSDQGLPPAYEQVTSSSSSSQPRFREVSRNGISPQRRRSMEDENRSLPPNWIRQYDAHEGHQFFVDVSANPPRSIWHHPYDDEEYLNSLSPNERSHIQGLHRVPSLADIEAESSDDDDHDGPSSHAQKHATQEIPPTGVHKFGRKMKDRITHTTHEEREAQRKLRAAREERVYQQHQMYRAAMSKAAATGEPQLIGKDNQGKDVYIEPPYGGGQSYPGQNSYRYNPYSPQGPYYAPGNARYIRPAAPYSRPYGGTGFGYGGGMGLPLMMGMGLGGGLLLGGGGF